jgi:hypothetical protein
MIEFLSERRGEKSRSRSPHRDYADHTTTDTAATSYFTPTSA